MDERGFTSRWLQKSHYSEVLWWDRYYSTKQSTKCIKGNKIAMTCDCVCLSLKIFLSFCCKMPLFIHTEIVKWHPIWLTPHLMDRNVFPPWSLQQPMSDHVDQISALCSLPSLLSHSHASHRGLTQHVVNLILFSLLFMHKVSVIKRTKNYNEFNTHVLSVHKTLYKTVWCGTWCFSATWCSLKVIVACFKCQTQ